jgi:hypothetical protein
MLYKVLFFCFLIVFIFSSCQKKEYNDSDINIPNIVDNQSVITLPIEEPIILSYGYVNNTICQIKENPDNSSNTIIELFSGRKVEILGYIDDWYYISCGNIFGYITKDDIVFDESLVFNNFDCLIPKGKART